MPILLPNVYLTTARSGYVTSTGATTAPTPYLAELDAHINPIRASQLMLLPESAQTSTYMALVETNTDIAIGDLILTITLRDNVRTPWPNTLPNVTYTVRYVDETTPVLFANRTVYIERTIVGGPSHL